MESSFRLTGEPPELNRSDLPGKAWLHKMPGTCPSACHDCRLLCVIRLAAEDAAMYAADCCPVVSTSNS